MKNICVFCGSSTGKDPAYQEAAQALAEELARRSLGLVYGGAKVGLMGILADAMISKGAEVTGVIVTSLARKEIAHEGISKLFVVESMHERKQKMYELSDAFIALPGGMGTLDEFFEIVTWAQLGYHQKPCGLLNIKNYYSKLLGFLDHATDQAFIKSKYRNLIQVADSGTSLLELFEKKGLS